MKNRKLIRIICLALVMIMSLAVFTGCGKRHMTLKDKTKPKLELKIEYDKVGALARWPHFSQNEGVISMRFNGDTWYNVRIVTGDQMRDATEGKEVLAVTTNMRAYASPEGPTDYFYIMDADPEGRYFFRFNTSTGPDRADYGNDFDTGIQYFCNGEEIVPDIPKTPWSPSQGN